MSEIGEQYRQTRERLSGLLQELDDVSWETPVAATPGWRVHDVLGHLVGICEDALDGTISGPPTEEHTAAQVERHRNDDRTALLARWEELGPRFEELLEVVQIWPPVTDVLSHEQDIRTALGRPGARDVKLVHIAARGLVENLDIDANVVVDVGDKTYRSPEKPGPEYRLRTTRFEVLRFRMGRRTRDQVAALDWSPAPGDLVDQLFIFGPRTEPLHE